MAALWRHTLSVCKKCLSVTIQLQEITTSVRHNSNRAAICNVKSRLYKRLYLTTIVQPDGSTINARYPEPRRIIKLPLDMTTLSEEEKRARLQRRKPKVKIEVKEEVQDDFKSNKYSHLWKKKK